MAASGEITQHPGPSDEGGRVVNFEDAREGKKKKFRPFEAVRKFFKGSKKGGKSDKDGVKSRSLQMINQDESDDDGGFRRRHPMGEGRSMSEDSVFQPEVKDPKIEFRKTAISMESLNKDFQSELASKLKKRYSLHSSDDEALPKSPTPPADFNNGSSEFQPLPINRGSDISIDTSETEEDDIFKTDWRKSVASISERKSSVQSIPETPAMDLDLSSIGQDTVILSNDAARHRISVKRNLSKRRPSASKKGKETKMSTSLPLPQVKEESPVKSDTPTSPVRPEPVSSKSPVRPEPVSPKSPLSPVSPKSLSPKPLSPKQDLFSARFEEKANETVSDVLRKTPEPSLSEASRKAEEHKTVISIGQSGKTDTNHRFTGPPTTGTQERAKMMSMSLDRKSNFNLSDFSKPHHLVDYTKPVPSSKDLSKPSPSATDYSKPISAFDSKLSENSKNATTSDIGQIAKLSRQRPKSLHDSQLPSVKSEEDTELSRTFNKLKHASAKEAESAITIDTRKDTGFVLVGSKNKEKEIPFGARRPEPKIISTSFNEGISSKPDATTDTTQASATKSDLVKPVESPTKTNFTYVLKKEPLKSQSSLSQDKKDNSPTKPNVAIETNSEMEKDSKTVMESKSEKSVTVDSKGAETNKTKENYENVTLNSDLRSSSTSKDAGKSDIVIISSAKDKSGYDNVVIGNSDANKLASPREDYKLKRQSRSKTLPEHPVAADLLDTKPTTRKDSLTQSFKIKEGGITLEKTETKPLESKPPKPFSNSMSSTSTTPTWMKMARQRQEEAKEKEQEASKEKERLTAKPSFSTSRTGSIGSIAESARDKSAPKSVFSSGSVTAAPKATEPSGFRVNRTSFKGTSASTSDIPKDTKVTPKPFSAVGSVNKDTKASDVKTETKTEEKPQPKTASSLAKSFESSFKSSNMTGSRNVSIDSPKGWKPPSKVKIEIIEKENTSKVEESSKPQLRTTTARKFEEKSSIKSVPEKCVDRKSNKVLDMAKMFQKVS